MSSRQRGARDPERWAHTPTALLTEAKFTERDVNRLK